MPEVTGPFDVEITPQEPDPRPEAALLGRLSIDKTFFGPLAATSVGQMLASRSAMEGSAGYVAMELVTGTLDGRSGSFVLQHSGHSDRGVQSLQVVVVADSGTRDLKGLKGDMQIVIGSGGEHSYVFRYSLPG